MAPLNKSFPGHLLASLYCLNLHLVKQMRSIAQGTVSLRVPLALLVVCQCNGSCVTTFVITNTKTTPTPMLLFILIILQVSTQQKKYHPFLLLSARSQHAFYCLWVDILPPWTDGFRTSVQLLFFLGWWGGGGRVFVILCNHLTALGKKAILLYYITES